MAIDEAALDEKIAALKELIREANGTLKDIRAERAATEKLIRDFRENTDARLNEILQAVVTVGLQEFGESIDKAIEKATEKVDQRFNTIADLLLGESPEDRAAGKPSLETLARRVKAKQAMGHG